MLVYLWCLKILFSYFSSKNDFRKKYILEMYNIFWNQE